MCYNYLVKKKKTTEYGSVSPKDTTQKKIFKKEVYSMKNTITKKEIYTTLINLVNAQENLANKEEILDRLNKDIEQASKASTKKETENDKLNQSIQSVILDVLEGGSMAYSDFVKAVQGKFTAEISAQKITANVTKLKAQSLIVKYEDGKGKSKKLYIKLA